MALPPASDDAALPGEFTLIARHFRPLAGPGALELSDDAAVFAPPPGRELVVAADAMVAGVHFLPEDPAETIGRKLLRTNLSDLAAMGAVPLGYLMTTAFPRGTSDAWVAAFAAGLALDQVEFGLHVLGGDTVSTPGPMVLSLTIIGHVAPGTALRRNGARPGDLLWVSGTIGDGAQGLRVLQGKAPADAFLAGRYRLPQPRLGLGQRLVGVASACMDVSDGLVQDLGHLCRASGCGAVLRAADVPASPQGASAPLALRLTGGDDYELLFAAPAAAPVAALAAEAGAAVTCIGSFTAGPAEVLLLGPNGAPLVLDKQGWSHF